MSSTIKKALRAKLASCCFSCYLVPPSSTKSKLHHVSPDPILSSEHQPNPSPLYSLHDCCRHSVPSTSSFRLYQCPQCQTSMPDMSQQWLLMDSERASWAMPQHLKDFKVKVKCRDCHREGDAAYHIIGLKCPSCGSYNTVRCGNEEIPMDATIVGGLLNQLAQQRRRRRRRNRQQRNGDGGGTSSSSSESESDEGDNHRNQHMSDSDDEENPGNQFRPRSPQHNGDSHHRDGSGGDPANHPSNEGDNSQSYDGDASENDDIDSDDESSSCSSSDCDSDSDYYEAQRSRTYVSFAQRGHAASLSPVEVPADSEPGALEWWQDPNESEVEPRTTHQIHDQRPSSRGVREEYDGRASSYQRQREQTRCQERAQFEPHLAPGELNSPTEVRRRAIAQSIVQNMRLWNSDSESFSELSSEEEEKSSNSWFAAEEAEVTVRMRQNELHQQEEAGLRDEVESANYRDIPVTTMGNVVTHAQSESGVESAESWFTSSDNSHSQPCSHEQDDKLTPTRSGRFSDDTLDAQRKVERTSVCSSATDDSLAWETAFEELPVSSM